MPTSQRALAASPLPRHQTRVCGDRVIYRFIGLGNSAANRLPRFGERGSNSSSTISMRAPP